MGKGKYSKELKIEICKRYIAGQGSTISLAREIGASNYSVLQWIKKYKAYGESAFDEKEKNASYTKEFKQMVVDAYLSGEGSTVDIAVKYKVGKTQVNNWVNAYNSHKELEDYIPGGKEIYMTKCRKVDSKERLEIVKYCLDHNLDYKAACKVFDVTYANVYNWVKKYKERGEEGLSDKRGRHKTDEEVDEVTLLKRQLKQKEHELEMARIENLALKKLDEIERRRYAERAGMKSNIRQSEKSKKKIQK